MLTILFGQKKRSFPNKNTNIHPKNENNVNFQQL